MPTPLIIATLGLILIWLAILSFILYRTVSQYNSLGKGVSKENLSTILEKVLANLDLSKKDIAQIISRCDNIEKEALLHTQKIGLVRFNPFSDTGGDQSFILSLLNGKSDGLLISILHGRTGTRWYEKKIKEGRGIDQELSDEEKSAVKGAKAI